VGLFGRRKAAEQALAQAQAELRVLQGQVSAAESARQELVAERDLLVLERDGLRDSGRDQDQALAAAETAAAEARQIAAAAQAAEAEARESARKQAEGEGGDPGPSWPLVLADMTRRWANTVGIQPGDRAMKATDVPGQIAEALDREVERVREEVGVDVSVTVSGDLATTQPVVFLLAATDLLGAMVSTCERVAVTIEDGLLIVGDVFTELGDDVEASRQRAVDAGLTVDPVEVTDDRVQVRLRS
jgi:multidrug efflux pump subunit AcrA (membrane-fusion protein)